MTNREYMINLLLDGLESRLNRVSIDDGGASEEAMEKEVDDYRKKSMDVSDIVDSRIKAIAERDVYKELYMKLLERAISA